MSRLRKVGDGRWALDLCNTSNPINLVEGALFDEVLIKAHEVDVPCEITKSEALYFMFKLISVVEYKENEAVIQFKNIKTPVARLPLPE